MYLTKNKLRRQYWNTSRLLYTTEHFDLSLVYITPFMVSILLFHLLLAKLCLSSLHKSVHPYEYNLHINRIIYRTRSHTFTFDIPKNLMVIT